MEISENKYREIECDIKRMGYTLSDIISAFGKYNSKLLMMSDEKIETYVSLYDEIDSGELLKQDKGRKLEELVFLLFKNGVENVFDVYRNCRTSTNEVDLLVRWTENAKLANINSSYSYFGDYFLCECKNYDSAVGVTYVGKFSSLMSVSGAKFGVMISWEGVTGKGDWTAAKGLIRKIALSEKKYIIVLDKDDLRSIRNKQYSIFSLLYNKYISLINDVDYSKYIIKHEAEDMITIG